MDKSHLSDSANWPYARRATKYVRARMQDAVKRVLLSGHVPIYARKCGRGFAELEGQRRHGQSRLSAGHGIGVPV